MALAQSKASTISERILPLFYTGRFFSSQSPEIMELEQEGKDIARNVDMGHGYTILAAAAMLTGNFKSMQSRFEIAENNGADTPCKLNRASTLAQAGFLSMGTDYMRDKWELLSPLDAARLTIGLSHYARLKGILTKHLESFLPNLDEKLREMFQGSLRVADFLESNQISDEMIVQLFDYTGTVLRNNRFFKIDMFYKVDLEENVILISNVIPADAELCSQMTMELAMLVNSLPISQFVLCRFVEEE